MSDFISRLLEAIEAEERDVRENKEWDQWAILPSRLAVRIRAVLRRCEADREILAMYDARFSDDYIWQPILKALAHGYGITEEET